MNRENRPGRFLRVGAVRAEHPDGREARASRYVNHLGQAGDFGSPLEALAIECGSLTAKTLVFLGDGAAWLWKLAETRFPRAVQILDFWHALEYAGAVAREAFPKDEAAGREWLSARAGEMKRSAWGEVDAALDSARAAAPVAAESAAALVAAESAAALVAAESAAAPVAAESAARYFTNNRCRMDYAGYLRRGLCIGSGLVESSCKRLVTQWLKGSGMHWSERGAQIICSLRGLFLGGEWEDLVAFWNRQFQTPMLSPHS